MTLSEELSWRGLIKDKTFADLAWLDKPQSFYLGIDASADSLTVGNLAVLLLAKRLQKAGWKAVLLGGGATSLIGDPGGKDEERQLKTHEEIAGNVARVKTQIQKLFEGQDFTLVDNYDWFRDVHFLDFLRDVGKHYSMTELTQRDFIAERMGESGSGISYAEFSYTLIQGYDFWQLLKDHGVVLQIGGSDQWGNMLSGVSLVRKKENKEVQALSMPLIVDKSTGKKFGKSEEGAIWLDSAKTTPTQFYQFWINADDESVEDYLKVFTELDKAAVEAVMAEHRQNPQLRPAQVRLAEAVTALVHSPAEMHLAQDVTNYMTGKNPIGEAAEVLEAIRQEIPAHKTTGEGSIIQALVDTGLAASNTDARRLLTGDAVFVNGQKVSRDNFQPGDFQNGRLLLRKGKKFKDSALIEMG